MIFNFDFDIYFDMSIISYFILFPNININIQVRFVLLFQGKWAFFIFLILYTFF